MGNILNRSSATAFRIELLEKLSGVRNTMRNDIKFNVMSVPKPMTNAKQTKPRKKFFFPPFLLLLSSDEHSGAGHSHKEVPSLPHRQQVGK